ncbi:hypothetical protein M0Q50_03770 [bacterium]|jgi:hypothetical protein|nr:hypothetical protein [bacterium]
MKDIHKNLMQKMLDASNEIAKNSRYGSGDFIVTNIDIYNVINEIKNKEYQRKLRIKKLDSL